VLHSSILVIFYWIVEFYAWYTNFRLAFSLRFIDLLIFVSFSFHKFGQIRNYFLILNFKVFYNKFKFGNVICFHVQNYSIFVHIFSVFASKTLLIFYFETTIFIQGAAIFLPLLNWLDLFFLISFSDGLKDGYT
jgi:hypothetical protein